MEINTEPEKKPRRHGAKISIRIDGKTKVLKTFETTLKKEFLIGFDEKCNIRIKNFDEMLTYPGVIARVYRDKRQIWMENHTTVTILGTPNKSLSPGKTKIALGDNIRFDVRMCNNIVMFFEARPELPPQEKAPVLAITNSDINMASGDDVIITSVVKPQQLPPSRNTRSKTPIMINILDSDSDDEDAVVIMQTQ